MGGVDVIQAIFDSYALIREHYREVALPLIALLVLSGAANLGGRGFSGSSWNSPNYSSPNSASSLIANAADGASGLLAMLATGLFGMLLAFVILAIVAAIIVAILDRAVWFYVYEHFYAILAKRRLEKDWKPRIRRHLKKAATYLLLCLIGVLVLLAAPIAYFVLSHASPASIVVVAVAMLLLIALTLVFTPLWIFFAMDGMGILDSAKKSASLVAANPGTFAVFYVISMLVGLGEVAAVVFSSCCCLSWIVAPLLSVFFGLVLGVALMKIKLQLEKK